MLFLINPKSDDQMTAFSLLNFLRAGEWSLFLICGHYGRLTCLAAIRKSCKDYLSIIDSRKCCYWYFNEVCTFKKSLMVTTIYQGLEANFLEPEERSTLYSIFERMFQREDI